MGHLGLSRETFTLLYMYKYHSPADIYQRNCDWFLCPLVQPLPYLLKEISPNKLPSAQHSHTNVSVRYTATSSLLIIWSLKNISVIFTIQFIPLSKHTVSLLQISVVYLVSCRETAAVCSENYVEIICAAESEMQSVLYILYCTDCTARVALYRLYCTYCTVHIVLYMLCCTYYAVHIVLYIFYCTYCTVHVVLYIFYCTYQWHCAV